ncbi:hypothetical protein C8Q78DRAFT_987095 [Trametes maxima]|nr:hypothetical protein C8Q78DRAFT_987095 [Trametes maxima]
MTSADIMNLFDFNAFEDVTSWFIPEYPASMSDSDGAAPHHELEQDQPPLPSHADSSMLSFLDFANGGQTFLPNAESISCAPEASYSGSTTPTLPESPLSVASEDTLVGPLDHPFDNASVYSVDAAKWKFDESFSEFSFRPDGMSPVMYPGSTCPTIQDPQAYSSLSGIPAYGQPQQQHPLGAVDASASWETMSTPAEVTPLTFQAEVPLPEKPCVKRGVNDDDSGAKKPAKRRKQPTDKKFICPRCGHGSARRNNLDVHIKAVHEGLRAHACSAPGCTRAFSRKHDLQCHFQSEHTDKGSPRRKGPKASAA